MCCFLPGGPVAVSGDPGPVAQAINSLKQHVDRVVWTQDWHPANHVSFAPVHQGSKQPREVLQLAYTCMGSRWLGQGVGPRLCNYTHLYPAPAQSVTCVNSSNHSSRDGASSAAATNLAHAAADAAASLAARIRASGCPEPVTEVQQVLWPPHCVAFTAGARLHSGLHVSPQDLVVRKGWQPFIDAYSAFEDNGNLTSTGLAQQLRQEGIARVVVVGVALDYCVLWSALDAVAAGFQTVVVLEATLPVSAAGAGDAIAQMRAAGVVVVQHAAEFDFSV